MSGAAWGKATKSQGGEGDPNILKLGDQTRVRPLDAVVRRWRQHGVTSPTDSEQFRSVNCPRGADGTGNVACPLCAKPTTQVVEPVDPQDPAKGTKKVQKQLFPISRRFAVNVFDYESNSVKVLIAGPQVFEEFDSDAEIGYNPTDHDYIIHKVGKDRNTSYKVRRAGDDPLPVQVGPDDLHDLDKYEDLPTTEAIFATLDQLGIDYDAITLPSFTLAEAREVILPYTKKHKGETMEQLFENDPDFMMWLYGQKRSQGAYGDPIFQAMHTVLLDAEMVDPLDEIPQAPPRPQASADTNTGVKQSGMTVTLLPPGGGDPQQIPVEAVEALKAAGYTEPPEPEPAPAQEPSKVKLIPPGGDAPLEFDGDQKAALLAAGFTEVPDEQPAPDPEPEPEAEPLAPLPADTDMVKVSVGGNDADLPFASARGLVDQGVATFQDADLTALYQQHKDAAAQEAEGAPGPTPASGAESNGFSATAQPTSAEQSVDPALTQENPDGTFQHPALPKKDYKTRGAVTQALNRLGKADAAPAQSTAAPAANGASPAAASDSPREALMDECRGLLAQMPEVNADFNQLLALFKEVANKQSIADFTDSELAALRDKLNEKLAAKATA